MPIVIGFDPGKDGAAVLLEQQPGDKPKPLLVFSWTESSGRYRLSCFSSLGESRISRHDSEILLGHALAEECVVYCRSRAERIAGALIEAPHVGKNVQGALSLARWAWSFAGAFSLSMISHQRARFDVFDVEVGMWRKAIGLWANERLAAREKILAGIPALIPEMGAAFAHFHVEGENDHVANASGIALVAMKSRVWVGSEEEFHQRVEASYTRSIKRT